MKSEKEISYELERYCGCVTDNLDYSQGYEDGKRDALKWVLEKKRF